MKKSLITLIVSLVVAIVVLFSIGGWVIGKYNTLVTKQETVKSTWSQVENVYQRRLDLIPNLVSTVKGYANHENQTLIGVVEARAKATQTTIDPSNMTSEQLAQFSNNQQGLSGALSKLMVVMEAYPDLKANQNFRDLQAQLEGTENRIAVERKRFNDAAKDYNTYLRSFPTNIIGKMFSFDKYPYFQAEVGSEKAPVVVF